MTIILTGNYNFFNLLTSVLCLSILNDSHIEVKDSSDSKAISTQLEPKSRFLLPKVISKLITYFIYFSLIYWTIKLFQIKWISGSLSMNISFNNSQLNEFIVWSLYISISLAVISLASNILLAITRFVFNLFFQSFIELF